MCIFISRQTLTFSASLSPSHFSATFTLLFLVFPHLSIPFGCFPLFVHGSALLPHVALPLHPDLLHLYNFLAFLTLFPNKQSPPPRCPSPSPSNPTSSTLPSLPIAPASVTPSPLQIPDPSAMQAGSPETHAVITHGGPPLLPAQLASKEMSPALI